MSKTKFFKMHEEGEPYENLSQEVSDPESGKTLYSVYDMAVNCPEDAVICRDLVSAHQWLKIVNYGIELAKQGYDKAEFEEMVE